MRKSSHGSKSAKAEKRSRRRSFNTEQKIEARVEAKLQETQKIKSASRDPELFQRPIFIPYQQSVLIVHTAGTTSPTGFSSLRPAAVNSNAITKFSSRFGIIFAATADSIDCSTTSSCTAFALSNWSVNSQREMNGRMSMFYICVHMLVICKHMFRTISFFRSCLQSHASFFHSTATCDEYWCPCNFDCHPTAQELQEYALWEVHHFAGHHQLSPEDDVVNICEVVLPIDPRNRNG